MNEMLLYAGFMNGVTSLFVPNLCSEQDNLAQPTKRSELLIYTVVDFILHRLNDFRSRLILWKNPLAVGSVH